MKHLSVIALAACLTAGGPALAGDKYPDVTADGLPRVERDNLDAVYWLPEADLSGYRKILIADCDVSFRKNWQRDQNRDRRLIDQVRTEDMERIRADMAARFRDIFVKELQENGDFEIVDSAGEDVLMLKPEIVDLDIFAPDVQAPNRNRYFTTSAGRMTLKMDFVDAQSGMLIGRVIDRRRAREDTARIANSVTNRVEMDRIMRRWARILRDSISEPA